MNTFRDNQTGLEKKLEFERLISDLSAQLIIVPSENIDALVTQDLEKLRIFFHVDHAAFLRYSIDLERADILFPTHAEGHVPLPEHIEIADKFPSLTPMALQGENVVIPSVDALEAGLETDKHSFQELGIQSIVIIPILPQEKISYAIAIAASQDQEWPIEMLPRLRLFGEIVIGKLERLRILLELTEAEKKYRTIANYTYDMECWQDPEGKLLYISPSCKRITGFSTEEFMARNDLLHEIIHPEDRQVWKEHLDKHEKEEEYRLVQIRIIRKEGDVRWIEHADQPVIDEQGRFLGMRSSNRDITDRKEAGFKLKEALTEITELKKKLEAENIYLKDYIIPKLDVPGIVAQSAGMQKVMDQVYKVASTDSAVLVTGETGTGKELVARTIHHLSKRKNHLMVTVNCAALPASLIESELFGREKGAYTGAMTKQIGRFEMANDSTIFLDEIGEMPQDLQVKLLRVLQFGEFERLGSPVKHKVDVRLIAASNRDIRKALKDGSFREDLYYRLNVFPIHIPPLRERTDDIPPLVWYIVSELSEHTGKRIDTIPRKEMEKLLKYSWPGNVRELRNVIEHAMIVATGHTLEITLPQTDESEGETGFTLEEAERNHILRILRKTHWRVRGAGGAAEMLGLNEATLRFRMKKLGIKRPE